MTGNFCNPIKQKIKNHVLAAAWEHLASPLSAELLAHAGFDIVIVDLEHSPADISQLPSIVQAITCGGAVPFVRSPWNDQVFIKRILDCGAKGILIPYISTREEAEQAVMYCKYPPYGVRGFAKCTKAAGYGTDAGNYSHRINDELMIILAIETPEGVANAEEILDVDGVDGVFIGPADLSVSMNHMDEPNHPEVLSAIQHILTAAKQKNKRIGTIPFGNRTTEILIDQGYDFIVAFSDVVHLSNAARAAADNVKKCALRANAC